jgi:DNA-binding MarR family transcriptional regulator
MARSADPDAQNGQTSSVAAVIRELALFRYSLRKFLRFSEKAARQFGVTPQQHQLMLGVAGYTDRGTATISELAEFLQERHHSVVELIERAVQKGLVSREQGTADRRIVIVSLTPLGEELLVKLSTLHQEEIERVRTGFLNVPGSSATGAKKSGTKKRKRTERKAKPALHEST